MTYFDPRVEVALESARGAREPTAVDRARNLAALEQRLGPLRSAAPAAAKAPGGARGAGSLGGAVSALKWKLASLAVATATLGFLVGLGLGQQVSSTTQGSPLPAAAVAALEPAVVAASAAPRTVAVEPPESTAPAAAQHSERPVQSASPPGQRAARGAVKQALPAARDAGFLAALRLLQRAQRALDGGDAGYAMSLLDELDAGFAENVLAEERQVTRALAWCALGDTPRAQRVAASVLRSNANSIYAGRLERSCAR